MRKILLNGIIILTALWQFSCKADKIQSVSESSGEPIFELLDPSQSGLQFRNDLVEDLTTRENLLDFDYFYNGAGVGIGDFNNDGLYDVFMAGNQVENKLFLNKGDLRFEDISSDAGINVGKKWSNGVSLADVNGDGYLDIYVSQGGPYERDQRANLLYINQGDLTFSEEALEYGLHDKGISTQSAFFDYDRDGDLDCFVMNESELYGFDPVSLFRQIVENPGRYEISFSHLYRNDEGRFTKVSRETGIVSPTFGLGLVISDINDDGWLDIYVANDYFLPDNMYLNQQDGSFTDRSKVHLKQQSFYGMGADIADINNDGFQDIMVLDMASKDHIRSKTLMASMDVPSFDLLVKQFQFPHQYMFNTLQLNDRNGQFNNIAHMAGFAKSDWSWAVLAEDLNLDGKKDLFITNGYRRYALDNDFKARVVAAKQQYNNQVPLEVKKELYESMPSETLPNLLLQNLGDLNLKDVSSSWGMPDPSFSNGAAVADLDNDGDLDVVVNNIDQDAFLYRNLSVDQKRNNYLTVSIAGETTSFAKVKLQQGDQVQFVELKQVRGYMSSMPEQATFGLESNDKVESIEIEFPGGKVIHLEQLKPNQRIEVREADGQVSSHADRQEARSIFQPFAPIAIGINYKHEEDPYNDFALEVLLPQKQSTLGPYVARGDVNGDGLEDIYLGGASGQPAQIYLQRNNGSFQQLDCPSCKLDKDYEDLGAVLFDLEGDGDKDLYVVSGGNSLPADSDLYEDRLYLNDGSGRFTRTSLDFTNRFSGSCVKAFDYDRDGDDDLLICNRIIPQRYPMPAPSMLLTNDSGVLRDRTNEVAPGLSKVGIINDALITDFDADGLTDFVVVGEWTGIHFFRNEGAKFVDRSNELGLDQIKGWWFSVHETDLNADGRPDYLVGNVGANIKHKASPSVPFKVYLHDFDSSGTMDLVLSTMYKDRYVPVRGKECSTEQMPFISQKFPQYFEFASASLVDIYGAENLEAAYQAEATEFASIVLIANDEGGFDMQYLPREAQAFPVLDALMMDLNDDGLQDAIIAGCLYETEVETPRLDAGSGMVLLSNGSGYELAPCPEYCFHIPGNVKHLDIWNLEDGRQFIVALCNDAPLSMIQYQETVF